MLVLTRKLGEGIAIGDDIKIVVMQIKGKQVRLGIKASPTTTVHREEIYRKIQEENERATGSISDALDAVKGVIAPSSSLDADTPVLFRKKVRSAKDQVG